MIEYLLILFFVLMIAVTILTIAAAVMSARISHMADDGEEIEEDQDDGEWWNQ